MANTFTLQVSIPATDRYPLAAHQDDDAPLHGLPDILSNDRAEDA
jgi:hypothetical protein